MFQADQTAHAVAGEIRAEIARKQLTDQEVALQAGIPKTTFSRKINRGNFTLDELFRVSEAIGVSAVDLISPALPAGSKPAA